DLLENPLPEPTSVRHRIGFVTHQHALAWLAVLLLVFLRIIECVTDHALYALTCVDVFLDRHLIRSSLLKHSTEIAVDPFRVLADHNEIDVAGLNGFQGTQRGIQQANRTHVRVQVHFETHSEQDLLSMKVRRHTRISESAYQNSIEIATQHSEAVRRNGRALL